MNINFTTTSTYEERAVSRFEYEGYRPKLDPLLSIWIPSTPDEMRTLTTQSHDVVLRILPEFEDRQREPLLANQLQSCVVVSETMTTEETSMKGAAGKTTSRIGSRKCSRGFSHVMDLLHYGAVLGMIVYPMSVGARAAGKALSNQIDYAQSTVLTQTGH